MTDLAKNLRVPVEAGVDFIYQIFELKNIERALARRTVGYRYRRRR